MKKYLKLAALANCKKRSGAETISKNGTGPKNQTSRRNAVVAVVIVLFASVMLQSCMTGGMMAVNYNHPSFSEGINAQTIELSGHTIHASKFNIGYAVGFTTVAIPGILISGNEYEEDLPGLSLSLKPTYVFSRSRFQPFAGCNFNWCIINDSSDEDGLLNTKKYGNYSLTATPNVGARFFLSKRFALNGNVGYQIGNIKLFDERKSASGLSFSAGISFTFGS